MPQQVFSKSLNNDFGHQTGFKKLDYDYEAGSKFRGGVLPLPTDGVLHWGSKNWPYVGLIFAKKVSLNGTKIPKFS